MALIEVKNLLVRRNGRTIIDGLDIEIPSGKLIAITGPNGCGKSTLLGAIAGDIEYQRGEIYFDGRALSTISLAEQASIRSVVLQERTYWLSYTAQEVIAMGQPADAIARIPVIAEALDMQSFLDQKVTTLSGGQAQRVDIARALIRDTKIYLLDEPLAAQDSKSQGRTSQLLRQLRDSGKTIVIIEHSDKQKLDWCDQIIEYPA